MFDDDSHLIVNPDSELEEGIDYIAYDFNALCKACRQPVRDHETGQWLGLHREPITLHTLCDSTLGLVEDAAEVDLASPVHVIKVRMIIWQDRGAYECDMEKCRLDSINKWVTLRWGRSLHLGDFRAGRCRQCKTFYVSFKNQHNFQRCAAGLLDLLLQAGNAREFEWL